MKIGIWTMALAALGLAGGVIPHASAQMPDDNYPYQARAGFSLNGTINQVDADRDRLVMAGDDGRTYTVDTYQSKIVLRDTDRAGQTGDLVPGMRLHITGSSLSRDLIEANRVSVLPYRGARPTGPLVSPNAPVFGQDQHVTLRGTVQSVDDRRGSFVVQINDHTRNVFLNHQTEMRDMGYDNNSDHIPLRPGDRVTVVGDLRDDGTVLATLVTPRILENGGSPEGESGAGAYQHGRTLLGRVSKESDYFSRDIKVRVSVSHEITVHVPKNIPIREDGRPVSIHDLKDDQVVRLFGDYENDDFKATRIDVLNDSSGNNLDF